MTKAFISYSHIDTRVLERLKIHLSMLEREGKLSAWSDREIHAGSEIDREISEAEGESLIFMPIVSPDFLASKYCYEREMQTALAKVELGEMLILPIIAEPCDWLASPLSKFKAVPRDGKPISEWTNENNAYLDIVSELRRILMPSKPVNANIGNTSTKGKPQLRIRRDFTSIDRDAFRDESFSAIRTYFQNSIAEIRGIEEIQARFEDMDSTAFTCSVVNRAKSNSESHITIRNNRGGRRSIGFGDIVCTNSAYADTNSANEIISVGADEYAMFLTVSFGCFFGGSHERDEKLSASQVADLLWRDFVRSAGVEYD